MFAWIRRLIRGSEPAAPPASQVALERTRTARRAAEEMTSVVQAAVAPIRRARQENHWAERIEAAYAARRGAAR
jgi:hypothetical protein